MSENAKRAPVGVRGGERGEEERGWEDEEEPLMKDADTIAGVSFCLSENKCRPAVAEMVLHVGPDQACPSLAGVNRLSGRGGEDRRPKSNQLTVVPPVL